MEPVDWEALLENCAGDTNVMREILDIFARDASRLLEDTRLAVERQDTTAVRHAAHRLKGSLLSLAAMPAMKAARALEVANLQDLDARFADLETELTRLIQSVRNAP